MQCPNCGSYNRLSYCGCTWNEIAEANRIKREQAARFRCRVGRPTVVEREREQIKSGQVPG